MALTQCRDCGSSISTAARSCPRCGAPRRGSRGARFGFTNIIGLLGLLFLLMLGIGPKDTGTSTKPTLVTCRTDWSRCADNRDLANNFNGMSRAQAECKIAAETQARYGAPSWPLLPFGSFMTAPDFHASGKFTLVENDAQFSNGFGAMVHSRVTCLYNLASQSAETVTVAANR